MSSFNTSNVNSPGNFPGKNLVQTLDQAVQFIREQCGKSAEISFPKIGIVLGSGLSQISEIVQDPVIIPYPKIPGFHSTSVAGHVGQMILGKVDGVAVVLLQGRLHVYEGYSMHQAVFPTRTLCRLGIETLILTNAAGGVNTTYHAGDIMLIRDHLNFMGNNPLIGPHLPELGGPRFPDLSQAYDRHCLENLQTIGRELGIPLQTGVYVGVLGPNYETPAEVKMFRTLGADAVGMSTVPECIVANHVGVQVAGISCIANLAADLSPHPLSHAEVVENSNKTAHAMVRLIRASIVSLAKIPRRSA